VKELSPDERHARGALLLFAMLGSALTLFAFLAVGVGLAIAELAR
jgi:hypothetical protein